MTTVTVSPQQLLTVESIKESEEECNPCTDECASDEISQVEAAKATLVDFEIRVEPPVTLFGSARFGLLQHESQLWKHEYASLEVVNDVEIAAKGSAAEIGLHNNNKPTEEVIDLAEIPTKEQNSVSESELLKDRKPDGGVQAVDLTGDERKEPSLSAEPDHCMNDKGIGEAELVEAREQKLTVHADLQQVCRHKVIDEGKNRIQVTKEISAVNVTVSATINKEATRKDTTTSETGKRKSDSSTTVGSSKGLNANLRRLYRSMNVSVSRPLPSLVELMGATKRPRVSQTLQL
ncbi:hypothetical protein HU200_028370 [Digitaria exilis]|uniref:Uncharacterized protein n=1 Tax=Digitaria exilis TaxID=1010633 RepID=A0A835BRJ1_9POAL|nr:hypothetical protein HU200_028370 [Digitaria exilis]